MLRIGVKLVQGRKPNLMFSKGLSNMQKKRLLQNLSFGFTGDRWSSPLRHPKANANTALLTAYLITKEFGKKNRESRGQMLALTPENPWPLAFPMCCSLSCQLGWALGWCMIVICLGLGVWGPCSLSISMQWKHYLENMFIPWLRAMPVNSSTSGQFLCFYLHKYSVKQNTVNTQQL